MSNRSPHDRDAEEDDHALELAGGDNDDLNRKLLALERQILRRAQAHGVDNTAAPLSPVRRRPTRRPKD